MSYVVATLAIVLWGLGLHSIIRAGRDRRMRSLRRFQGVILVAGAIALTAVALTRRSR